MKLTRAVARQESAPHRLKCFVIVSCRPHLREANLGHNGDGLKVPTAVAYDFFVRSGRTPQALRGPRRLCSESRLLSSLRVGVSESRSPSEIQMTTSCQQEFVSQSLRDASSSVDEVATDTPQAKTLDVEVALWIGKCKNIWH